MWLGVPAKYRTGAQRREDTLWGVSRCLNSGKEDAVVRRQLTLTGVVQGVGFRPNVARLAACHPITGLCGNDDNSVFIEAQGEPDEVSGFFEEVRTELPPLATIIAWREFDLAVESAETQFRIVPSRRGVGAITLIPADAAVCPDCLADMADPGNRRYGYPFTTCTNCGPRLSIIRDVPYDRPLTTMADFPMCEACRKEYTNPMDRRYHAQPISCFDCGPDLWLEYPDHVILPQAGSPSPAQSSSPETPSPTLPVGVRNPASGRMTTRDGMTTGVIFAHDGPESRPLTNGESGAMTEEHEAMTEERGPVGIDDRRARFARTIDEAKNLIREGKILAVKGIGGFTLMCDARNSEAVATLRTRKRRPGKPFAVMAGSVDAARRIADLGEEHVRTLTSREAPIVLAPMASTYDLADEVAPDLDDVGVMMAYAPLHRLLLKENDILVATSANSSSKPLTYHNEDARRDLSDIVDAFLMHDRGIHIPVEDSVVMADGGRTTPIRRSRGYAPLPVFLGADAPDKCVLAVGAELKNTFALTRDGMAFLSAHVGDMGSLETQAAFEKSVSQMITAHRRTPELVVIDKHPGYATHAWGIRYADRIGAPVLQVQHHHAHALSLLAENPADPPRVFIVLDGTGYGDDGTIWGGEILRLGTHPLDYERIWHLPGFWLPGGDSAVRNPWKSAMGLAWEYGIDLSVLPTYAAGRESEVGFLAGRESGVESIQNPDWRPARNGIDERAVVQSQLENHVGVVRTTSTGRVFDAAASILGIRQSVTYEAQAAMELETIARRCPHDHEPVDTIPDLVNLLVEGDSNHGPVPCLAKTFHSSLARVIAQGLYSVVNERSVIGLTGGVLANRLLTAYLVRDLESLGHRVRFHQIVPANDGGLALGQGLAGVLNDER